MPNRRVRAGNLDASGYTSVIAAKGRPQPVNQAQDLSEQGPWDGDLFVLECDIAAMSHDLGTDLDQLFAQRGSPVVPENLIWTLFGADGA